jgi:hypothetical protein
MKLTNNRTAVLSFENGSSDTLVFDSTDCSWGLLTTFLVSVGSPVVVSVYSVFDEGELLVATYTYTTDGIYDEKIGPIAQKIRVAATNISGPTEITMFLKPTDSMAVPNSYSPMG